MRLLFSSLLCLTALASAAKQDDITLIESILPELEEWIVYGMNLTRAPGVGIAIVVNDTVAHLGGYGFRDVEAQLPVTPTTVFQMASVSKPITASLLAVLMSGSKDGENETFTYDTLISQLDPEFELSDPYVTQHLTVMDLLSHRSGLPDHAGDVQEDLGYTREEILHNLRFLPLGSFRQEEVYTNFGFSEAAFAVAKKVGSDFETLIQDRLFQPLGMTLTSSRYQDYIDSEERAVTYEIDYEGDMQLHRLDPPREPEAQSPAGGVSSTITDMAEWLKMQLGFRPDVVDDEALVNSHQPVILNAMDPNTGRSQFYGLGLIVSQGDDGMQYGHSGGFLMGARTEISFRTGDGIGLAVLSNGSPTGLPEIIAYAFWELVNGRIVDKDVFDARNDLVIASLGISKLYSYAAATNETYEPSLFVNEYSNDYYGTVSVKYNEGKDALQLAVGTKIFELVYLGNDAFKFVTIGENRIGDAKVDFTVNGSNKVESMNIDYLASGAGKAMGLFFPGGGNRTSTSNPSVGDTTKAAVNVSSDPAAAVAVNATSGAAVAASRTLVVLFWSSVLFACY